MEDSKLTVREESRIIREENLDYVPDSRGLGVEFYYAMLLNKDKVAQIDAETGDTDTYGDLLRRCIRVCMNLLVQGITKNDIICLCSSNNMNSCVPIICSYFLGVTAAPLDPPLSLFELTYLFNEIRPRIIFVSPEVIEKVVNALKDADVVCKIVVFGETEEYTPFVQFLEPVDYEFEFKPLPITNFRETAMIVFNCGKTKPPQGICVSHYCLMVQLINTVVYCNLGNMIFLSNYLKNRTENGFKVVMSYGTYFWLSKIHLLNATTITGISRIITHDFEPTSAWKLIDKYNVSFLRCSTHQAIQLYRVDQPEGVFGKSLRMLLTSGTRFTKRDLHELRQVFPKCFVTNCYEELKACGSVTMFSYTELGHIRDQYERPTSCGKLLPGTSCKIVDPITEKILAPNQAGELRYKTHSLINGYYKSKFSVAKDENGWIKTDVIAFYDEKHCIFVLDPYEECFKYKCWDIVPSVIETVIKEHPAVKEAVVIGIPHDNTDIGQVPMGIVSLNRGMRDRVTEEDIRIFVNSILSKKQQIDGGVKIIKEMPLTPMGQPKRQYLKILIMDGDF